MRYHSTDKYKSIDLSSMSELEVLALREKLLSAPPEEIDIELIDRCNDRILKGTYRKDPVSGRRLFKKLLPQICTDEAAAVISRRKIKPKIAFCTLLVFLLLLTATALAMGLFKINWNREFFFVNYLSSTDAEKSPSGSDANTLTTIWGEEFVNALIEYDIQVPLPTWIPEGFHFDHVTVLNQKWTILNFLFVCEEKTLNIQIDKYPASSMRIVTSKDESETTKLTLHDIDYYISSNSNYNQVFWHSQNYGIHIYGNLEIAELEKMIDSIGG